MGSRSNLLQMVHDQRTIVDYFYVASTAFLVYDHLLTLHLEITLVWYQSRWTYTKILFLLARYFPYPGVFLFLYTQVFFDVPLTVCRWTYYAAVWFSMLAIISAEGIFMIRTWALCYRNRGVGFLLTFMTFVVCVVEVVSVIKFNSAIEVSSAPYEAFRGCFVTSSGTAAYIALYCLSAVDTVILVLTSLSAYRARSPVERVGTGHSISNIAHQDGILFYVCILCLTLTSATVVRFAPITLMKTAYPLPCVMYSVLSTRVILNIRVMAEAGKGGSVATELHTACRRHSISLAFQNCDASRNNISESDGWSPRK